MDAVFLTVATTTTPGQVKWLSAPARALERTEALTRSRRWEWRALSVVEWEGGEIGRRLFLSAGEDEGEGEEEEDGGSCREIGRAHV